MITGFYLRNVSSVNTYDKNLSQLEIKENFRKLLTDINEKSPDNIIFNSGIVNEFSLRPVIRILLQLLFNTTGLGQCNKVRKRNTTQQMKKIGNSLDYCPSSDCFFSRCFKFLIKISWQMKLWFFIRKKEMKTWLCIENNHKEAIYKG